MVKFKISAFLFCIFTFALLGCLATAQEGPVKKAVMIIAHAGFRDEELSQPKAILEQNGVRVTIASSSLDEAEGMLGLRIKPDMLLRDVNARDFDAVIFIGGQGASEYWDDPVALELAQDTVNYDRILAAICLAPVTLARAGVLEGKNATVLPSESGELKAGGANYTGQFVTRDGNIITASGPEAAFRFGEEVAAALNR